MVGRGISRRHGGALVKRGKTVTIGCPVDGPNADGQTDHSRRDRIKGTRPPEIFR